MDLEFEALIQDILEHETVKEMKKYRQHYETSCYDHCKHVAYYTYRYCKKHHLDYISATRAAMLHDFFLYDWRCKVADFPYLHGFQHPGISLKNAKKLFLLNAKEQDIIVKHMWPLTMRLPKYKESYVVSFADKYAAIQEICGHYKEIKVFTKIYLYAYVFLCLLAFKIV